jgi:hypothetical protein
LKQHLIKIHKMKLQNKLPSQRKLHKCLPRFRSQKTMMWTTMKWYNSKSILINLLDLKLKLHLTDSPLRLSISKKRMTKMMKKKCQWVNSQRQMQSEKSATTMMRRPLETMLLSNNSRFKCSNWSNNIKLNSIEARSTESLQSRARDRQNWLSSRWKESGKSNSINNNWHKDANKRFKSRSMRLRDERNRLANLSY